MMRHYNPEADPNWQHWPAGRCQHILCDDYASGTRLCLNCGKVFEVLVLAEHMNEAAADNDEETSSECCSPMMTESTSRAVAPPSPPSPPTPPQTPIHSPTPDQDKNHRSQLLQQQPPLHHRRREVYSPFPYDAVIREFLMDTLASIHMDQGYLVDRIVGKLYRIACNYIVFVKSLQPC